MTVGHVFGYGSLSRDAGRGAPLAHLRGYARRWEVAMDNRLTLPGYKYYLDAGGERPAVYVTFLDIRATPGTDCVGFLLPVTAEQLPALDRRERNYDRIEVTDRIVERTGGPVWTYVGSPAGRARYEAGCRTATAVVAEGYLALVEGEFHRRGDDVWADFTASTVAPACPVRALRRVDVPDGPDGASI